jgi:hypothetical protein
MIGDYEYPSMEAFHSSGHRQIKGRFRGGLLVNETSRFKTQGDAVRE